MSSVHKPNNKVGLQLSGILQPSNFRHLQTDDRRRSLLSKLKTKTNLVLEKERVKISNTLTVINVTNVTNPVVCSFGSALHRYRKGHPVTS